MLATAREQEKRALRAQFQDGSLSRDVHLSQMDALVKAIDRSTTVKKTADAIEVPLAVRSDHDSAGQDPQQHLPTQG